MIVKVMADGARVGGLLTYMLKGANAAVELDPADEPHLGEDEERELGTVEYRNLASDNRRDAAREMEIVARRSARCKEPFLHYAIAWPPDEKPSEKRMVEAMDRTLEKMGLQHHQAVYAVHREKDHLHIHAAINRVSEGRAWSRFKSFERLAEASHAVEKEMGFLPREQFAKHIADREVKPTAKQQRIYERTGVEPDLRFAQRVREAEVRATALADRIKDDARKAMRADSWETVHENLAQHGLGLREYINPKNPKRTGLEIVEFQTGERCAASAIGSDYGRAKLEKSGLGPFVPGPEKHRLRAIGYLDRAKPDRGHERAPQLPEAPQNPTPAEPQRDDAPLLAEYQAMRRARTAERQRVLELQRARDRERREQLRDEQAAKRRQTRELGGGRASRSLISEIARYGAALRDQLRATISGERKNIQAEYGLVTWTDFVRDLAERGDARAIAEMTKLNGQQAIIAEPLLAAAEATKKPAKPPFLERVAALQYNVRRVDAPQPGRSVTGEILDVDEDEGAVAIDSGHKIASILRVPVERARELFEMIGSVVKARYDHAGKWDFEPHDTQKQKENENEIPR